MEIKTQRYNPQFKALHIANCGDLKLYKITDKADFKFLKNLPDNIHTKDLMPNLTKDEYSRWDEMLQYAVDNSQKSGNITYIETYNNKPCGIITFSPDKNIFKLDCICTWPVEIGKKVKLAGQTLFYQLFKDFQQLNGKKLKLEAITNGPYDTISKYKKLSFIPTKTHPTKVEMETTAPKLKPIINSLTELLDYEEITPQSIRL